LGQAGGGRPRARHAGPTPSALRNGSGSRGVRHAGPARAAAHEGRDLALGVGVAGSDGLEPLEKLHEAEEIFLEAVELGELEEECDVLGIPPDLLLELADARVVDGFVALAGAQGGGAEQGLGAGVAGGGGQRVVGLPESFFRGGCRVAQEFLGALAVQLGKAFGAVLHERGRIGGEGAEQGLLEASSREQAGYLAGLFKQMAFLGSLAMSLQDKGRRNGGVGERGRMGSMSPRAAGWRQVGRERVRPRMRRTG
jgi:hypothetical protein